MRMTLEESEKLARERRARQAAEFENRIQRSTQRKELFLELRDKVFTAKQRKALEMLGLKTVIGDHSVGYGQVMADEELRARVQAWLNKQEAA